MTQPVTDQPPRKRTGLIIILVIAGIFGFLFLIGVPLAIYGVRKYLIQAKTAEGQNAIAILAQGVARCPSARPGGRGSLPPTAHPVPPTLASVQGMKYQSAPNDWQDEAYACAGFRISDPQYFQYQWVRTSPTSGVVRAMADLDGNAEPDFELEEDVTCADGASCTVGSLRDRSQLQ